MGQLMWGRVLPGDSTEMQWRCEYCRADGGTLEENIRGCDWEMQLIFRGNDYMPVVILYLKGPC
jgi:hypothetical protein